MAPIKHILFFLLLPISMVYGQTIELGAPYCENITPREIGYGGANSSISQDMIGTMYFGNFNGIITYNTLQWKLQKFTGNPLVYRDKLGHIYVGGYNQLGEFVLNQQDKTNYMSLIDSSYNFGQVTSIQAFRNQIYFIANKVLYKITDNKPVQITQDKKYLKAFIIRDVLYVANSKNLWTYKNGELHVFCDSTFIKNKKVNDIFRYNNNTIIVVNNHFYKIDSNNELVPFKTQIDSDLALYDYSCSVVLSDNTLCVGTKTNGIYFINIKGEAVNFLNIHNGLYDNTILDLFVDKANNLWVGYSNGIGRIEVPSAFTYFNSNNGLIGKVNTLIRFNNIMYVGTQKGIYKLIKSSSNQVSFKELHERRITCNSLRIVAGNLYAGTEQGLFLIENDRLIKVANSYIQTICPVDTAKYAWICSKDSVFKVNLQQTTFNKIEAYGPIRGNLQTFAQEKDGTIWLGTLYNGVYRIKNNKLVKIKTRGMSQTIGRIEVYETSKGVLFSTSEGLFRYDSDIQTFYADSKISIPDDELNKRVRPIVEDSDKNLWLGFIEEGMYENQISVAWHSESQEQYTLISSQFSKLNPFVTSVIYPDINSVVWFGGFDGLVRLDFKKLSTKRNPENTLIHKITLGADSILTDYKKSRSEKVFMFDYDENTIRFDFAAPIYESRGDIKYSYVLQGYEKDWSDPEKVHFKEYSNLPKGHYMFHVKAIDASGNIANEATFEFEIESHPYASWWAIFLYVIFLVSIVTIVMRWRAYQFVKEKAKLSKIIQEKTEELLLEKEKTENLLSNILPEETAKELKEKGRASSMRFNMATILFSDIQGFTKIAEEMTPDALIDELDKFFLEFDKIVECHNIEKIKTIGDAYMCAGGIPQKNRTNPIEVVVAALEMQHKVKEMQKEYSQLDHDYWGLRIGIHTGPIVAGVVGSKKFSYDIWGDSVNIASRMESSGEVGKVNISESTYLLVQEFFDCEYRGKMPVKYKGEIDMYFVKGFKVTFTEDPLKIVPNSHFEHRFSLQKFDDLQEVMFERLEKELPDNLYYHNLKHTIDVTVQIEIIGIEEKVSDQELLLLKTAALFHDAGFLLSYRDHEDMSQQLARSILPKYRYNNEQINEICDIIAVTELPHNPKTHLQRIMCDADLDYLGRDDYLPVSRDLYRELLEQGILKKSEYEWNKMQIKFLQAHKFFTESSKRRRNGSKNKQIEKLQEQTRSFNNISK